jgi:hypothetical protein
MKSLKVTLLAGSYALLATSGLQAQDQGLVPGVLIVCDDGDHESFKIPSTTLLTSGDVYEMADSTTSSVGLIENTHRITHRVAAGNFAECVYPNGHSVRVKVGEGTARPFGMCGADPPVFLSLWIDKRKVESGVQFAGRCSEAGPIRYSISERGIEKCQTGAHDVPESRACITLPAPERFPLDDVEYPAAPLPPMGSIEIRSGEDVAVCRAVQAELASNRDAFFGGELPPSFERPEFRRAEQTLDEELRGAQESEFDFDNDGAPDRVFLNEYSNNYMFGSTLLIDPQVSAGLELTDGWFLPCQFESATIPLKECPPFSQARDAAVLSVADPGRDKVEFSARYSHLTPFRYKGSNYLAVSGVWTQEFVAVLTPKPKRTFEQTCLLRKVSENF